jgi:electron transport complex protein RnfD
MKFNFRVSPNYRTPLSTQRIMTELTVGIALVLAYSVYFYFTKLGADYGIHALLMILTALGTSIVVEVLWALFYKKNIWKHLNTSFPWVTALLYVGMMGVNKPLYVIFIGSFIAIFIGKLVFGGFGHNIFNPAGVGRAVSVLSFGGFITDKFADVVTGATPNQVMETLGWVIKDPAVVTKYLDQFGGLWSLATGGYVGGLGETNTLLILAVGIYLAVRKIIDWRVPVVFLGSLFAFASILAAMKGMGIWYPVFHMVTGGAMFGAIFMMTDPVTSPTSIPGRIVFAFGVALLTFLIRVKGSLPEGMIRSILFMNMMTPLIDRAFDGWAFEKVKKYAISLTVIGALGFLTVGVFANQVDYIAPVVEEEPVVTINLKGEPVVISQQTSPTAVVVSEVSEGDVTTFVVNINGYAFQSDHSDDPKPNTLEIKVNTATQTIESVAYVTFSDSKNIGDKTNSDVFLSQFVGVSIVDETASVDVVSGATITSQSVVKAVNAAIAAALD